MTDNTAASTPIRIAPHGCIIKFAAVPTATPPANVAFCTCTWSKEKKGDSSLLS